ncbi:MAG: hypothetical protein EXQ83_17300 [Xanthobacteraceae bacterium]|nr:hypothetical protein [Xanthobacteraceae bacterium]
MLRKSTPLAVAASAALGLAMLAPTSASAMHGGGHGMHGHHGGHGGHFGHHRHRHPHWHVRYQRPVWYAPRPVYVASRPVAGPLHLPEQGIHPGRCGAVQGSLHQRGGDESSAGAAAADRRARAAGAAVPAAVRAAATATAAEVGFAQVA